jgi:hypothetical protein
VDEYGFPHNPRLKIYTSTTTCTPEEVQAAVRAALDLPLHSIAVAADKTRHNNAQAFTVSGSAPTLFEHQMLELNLGGVQSTALILRPTLSPTDATPSIRIQFAGPGRPQNTREAYIALQAIVLAAQAHHEGTSPLSPLAAALDVTRLRLVLTRKEEDTTVAYAHLGHAQANPLLYGLALPIPGLASTVLFRRDEKQAGLHKGAQLSHPPQPYEKAAIQLLAAGNVRTCVDAYIRNLTNAGIQFHRSAQRPYQVSEQAHNDLLYTEEDGAWRFLRPTQNEVEGEDQRPTRPTTVRKMILNIYPAEHRNLLLVLLRESTVLDRDMKTDASIRVGPFLATLHAHPRSHLQGERLTYRTTRQLLAAAEQGSHYHEAKQEASV